MKATFEVFLGRNGHSWYWHEKSRNGQIKSVSEAYTRKSSAKRAAARKVKETPGSELRIS